MGTGPLETIVKPHIDNYWLDAIDMVRYARQTPSTHLASEMLSGMGNPAANADGEPDIMVPGLHGAAIGYNAALACLRSGLGIESLPAALQTILHTVESSRKVTNEFMPAMIALALNDATELAQRGASREQLAAIWEANVIFAARKIASLRQ
jgi:hypothetical protein